ncbi:unnamed protein product [Amoebophrya sp. A25]|nr:unnamed protein product [Amoebophrya sp. A25]|eukprot:GSA25T00026091001.1
MDALGGLLRTAYGAFITPRMTAFGRVNVIKAGTFCRTVVWPCCVPLLLHQYIRGRDRDFYALELLAYKAKAERISDYFDCKKGVVGGHWRMQKDMEIIFNGVNGK